MSQQNMKKYTTDACSMTSCAFPSRQCSICLANSTIHGKQALKWKNPKDNYHFIVMFTKLKQH